MGAASPKTPVGVMMISRVAKAMMVPALNAFGLTHATVLAGALLRISSRISKVAMRSPPGVSNSMTTASQLSSAAS